MEQRGIELARRDADDRRATARSGKLSLSENPLIWYSISSEVYHELYLYCHLPRPGWTNDLEKRIKAHNEGKGAKYTKSRRPVVLTYYEEYETREMAMKREYEIKHLSRQKKMELINLKKESGKDQ